MLKQHLDVPEFLAFLAGFQSLPLSRIWFGDHLALYLELGQCIGNYGGSGRSMHERHIFAGYDWAIVDDKGTQMLRADLTESLVCKILGESRILSISLDAGEELVICLDHKVQLRTLGTEHPEWSLWECPDKNVSYEHGRPILEISS